MKKSTQATILRGFRDLLPTEKRKRDYIEAKMKTVFQRFGFEPLETPTLEYAELLFGKYGNEADKLIYRFKDNGGRDVGLRYDQTVPTARVLAQYQNELPKYFRRYQIQNVFRADKPQKGRYREFRQCDCDILGSTSPLADAEILAVFYAVYQEIGLKSLVIQFNDRQTLLATLSPFASEKVDVFSLIQSIDKLDKVSSETVIAELVQKGLKKALAQQALTAIENAEMSQNLQGIFANAIALGVDSKALKFNPRLARGLDYYTGLIFEGRISEYAVGSVGGGGRYDNLIKDLSGPDMPAVGFAIGFDRTVEAADQLRCIPTDTTGTQVLVTIFDQQCQAASLKIACALRAAGITTEVYPAVDKLAKQCKLADDKNIPFVVIVGPEEIKNKMLILKNLRSNEQMSLTLTKTLQLIQERAL